MTKIFSCIMGHGMDDYSITASRKLLAASPTPRGKEQSWLKSRLSWVSWVCQLASSSHSYTLRIKPANDQKGPGGQSAHTSPACWQKVQASFPYMAGHRGPGDGLWNPCRTSPLVRWCHPLCQTCATPFQHRSPGTWRMIAGCAKSIKTCTVDYLKPRISTQP